MITCSMHSRAKAAWRCTECHKDLCPDCAASGESQSGAVVRCKHCGALAIPLMEHREIQPYWKMFPAFLGAIVSLEGLLQILAVAVVMYLVSFIPLLGGLLSLSLWIAYYFSVIRKAAFGAERLPTISDFENPLDDMVAPLLRFVLASLILWAPTVWYIASHPDLVFVIKKPLLLFTDPVLILIMLAGILYFPGTIITAAISQSTISMLNPMVVLGIILRIPRHYLGVVAVWGLGSLLDIFLMSCIRAMLARVDIPVITPLLVTSLGLLIPLFIALVMGRVIYQNGEIFGLVRKSDLMVPVMPDAVPGES